MKNKGALMKISIIGLGLSFDDLTEHHLSMINEADVLAGGKRHLSYFPNYSGQTIEITKDLQGFIETLQTFSAKDQKIVVLASGDPLFYGIGSYLSRHLGKDRVRVYPNINSVAAAFSKINESWHDATVISMHGRSFENKHFVEFRQQDKLAVLTDRQNIPSRISALLADHNITDFRICVFEQLGMDSESIQWFAPGELVGDEFSEPNLMIFLRQPTEKTIKKQRLYLGMPDNSFQHERSLITKPEVRAVTLSKLVLESDSILWDLGAGSGSISIEASFFIKAGQIYAVEKNESRIRDIKENQKQFGVPNLNVIYGVMPEAIDQLPDPDRIFFGGGGQNLVPIIQKSICKLRTGGIIVINTVLLKNMVGSLDVLEKEGLETEVLQMQVNVGHEMPWNRMLKSQNPIWMVRGWKDRGETN